MDGKRMVMMAVVCVAALCVALGGVSFGAEKDVTLTGMLKVTMNAKGKKAESATLTADGTTYTVMVDGRGKDMAEEMDGKTVEIEGKLITKKGVTELRVMNYALVVTGVLKVTMDKKDRNVKSAAITSGADSYELVLEGKGAELAAQLDGQTVKVIGTTEVRKKGTWLTVRDFALSGTVTATKDSRGRKITDVTLTVGTTVYNIEMDDNGKALGEQLGGKKADVEGVVTMKKADKKEEMWVKVARFKEAK